METHVEFHSDRFPPFEEESDAANSGRFGKRLADFIAQGLKREGIETGDPTAEDWGWMVPVKNESFPLWVGCGNLDKVPDGFLCFIEPHEPTIRKLFRRIDATPRVTQVRQAIDKLLSVSNGIRDKKWWTYEAFNRSEATGA